MIDVGVDIIETKRIEEAIRDWQQAFLRRVYTNLELKNYAHTIPSLAARFAAKEATMKVLGDSEISPRWHEIEILSKENGAPDITLYGRAKDVAEKKGINKLAISLSHTEEYAVALVVGYDR